MVKFKFTPSRFAEACTITEYILVTSGKRDTAMRIAHRFVIGEDGEYIVKANVDDDGDIKGFENVALAMQKMSGVTPKRFEKLVGELVEAAKAIVDPPKGRDS